MQVFKCFFKIVKKNLSVVLCYLIVFSVLMVIFGATLKKDNPTYSIRKMNVYIECQDESVYTNEILDYLDEYVVRKNIGGLSIDDALFWNEIDMYIHIPEGFYEDFINGNDEIILIKTTPDNMNAYSLKVRIQNLLNQIKVNAKYQLVEEDKVVSEAIRVLNLSEESIEAALPDEENHTVTSSLFGYGFYVLFAIIITLTGTIMAAFKSLEIKRRMNISSISSVKLNTSLISGNICMAIFFSIVIFFMSYLIIGPNVIGDNAYLYLINNMVFSLSVVCIAYAFALIIHSSIALQVISVVLPLGSSFLCGIFVPKEFLSDGVLAVAHILPPYYAVCCNEYIASSTEIDAWKYISYLAPHLIFILISILIIGIVYKRNSVKEA